MQGRMKTAGDPGKLLDARSATTVDRLTARPREALAQPHRTFWRPAPARASARGAAGRESCASPRASPRRGSTRSRSDGSRLRYAWSSTRPGPVVARGAQLVGVDRGCRQISVTPGASSNSSRSTRRRAPGAHATTWSGNTAPSSAASRRNGNPATRSRLGVAQAHRQAELDRELEVHVEEVGAELERAEMAAEVAHVEAPHDRPLDLGPALAPDLVEVGVVPGVLDRAREAAVAVEQARRVGDRAPSGRCRARR